MASYTPRIRAPLLFIRGADTRVELEVWSESGLVAPASGTLTVYNDQDAVIVSGQSLSVDATTKRAYCTVLAASLPSTLEFSDAWRASWAISIGGTAEVFHQDAQLIRRPWRPSVTQQDLIDACPQLAQSYDADNQDDCRALARLIRAAVEDTQAAMCSEGHRPWLVFDAWKLNRYAVLTALGRVFRSHLFDQDAANFSALDKLAQTYEDQAGTEWGKMNFRYDDAETGKGADQAQRQAPAVVRIGITR